MLTCAELPDVIDSSIDVRYNTATREVIAGLNDAATMLGLDDPGNDGGAETGVLELGLPVGLPMQPKPPPPGSSKRKKSVRSRASKAVESNIREGASDAAVVLAPPSAGRGKHPVQTVVVLLPPDNGAKPAATATITAATSSIVTNRPNSNVQKTYACDYAVANGLGNDGSSGGGRSTVAAGIAALAAIVAPKVESAVQAGESLVCWSFSSQTCEPARKAMMQGGASGVGDGDGDNNNSNSSSSSNNGVILAAARAAFEAAAACAGNDVRQQVVVSAVHVSTETDRCVIDGLTGSTALKIRDSPRVGFHFDGNTAVVVESVEELEHWVRDNLNPIRFIYIYIIYLFIYLGGQLERPLTKCSDPSVFLPESVASYLCHSCADARIVDDSSYSFRYASASGTRKQQARRNGTTLSSRCRSTGLRPPGIARTLTFIWLILHPAEEWVVVARKAKEKETQEEKSRKQQKTRR